MTIWTATVYAGWRAGSEPLGASIAGWTYQARCTKRLEWRASFGTTMYPDEMSQDATLTPTNDDQAWTNKYVNDVNAGELDDMSRATLHVSQAKMKCVVRATGCEEVFKTISRNAASIGMQVNAGNTQLICISSLFTHCSSYFMADEQRIDSQESMILLGFAFNLVKKKYRARSWLLWHLKSAGLPTEDLVRIYVSTLRSVIEYVAAIYHPMINATQSEEIERLQRRILKIIYGWDMPYARALQLSGLPTLKERRDQILHRFTTKTVAHPWFASWFPEHAPYANDIYEVRKCRKRNTWRQINYEIVRSLPCGE